MNYTDIKQVFTSTSSLTMASYFSQEDQAYLLSDATLSNFPFGKSDKDAFQVSVFSFDGSQITSSYIALSGRHLPFTKSYYNVANKYTEYSYSSYQSDVVVIGTETKSVFLDVASTLTSLGVREGNYKVGIQLVRDIVGSHTDPTQRLLIQTISPSRTEISVVPVPLRSQVAEVNDEFYAFSSGKVMLKDVVDSLISGISRPEIYKIFYSVAAQNPNGADRFMFDYGFKQGTDVVNFLTDLYYGVNKGERRSNGQFSPNDILGIFDQFSNWAYQNYNDAATFQDIRDQYYSLFRYIINQELNRITNKKPDDFDMVVEFLTQIYYQSIFFPVSTVVESEYVNYISGYFKNYITFEDQRQSAVMNTKTVQSVNPRFHDSLVIKLDAALPSDISVGQSFWISNLFASRPILQNVYFYAKSVIKLHSLRGPNLNIKFENEGNNTDLLSIETLIGETGSLYDELFSKLEAKNKVLAQRAVDYRAFENFINFSSAGLRLNVYSLKLDNLTKLEQDITDLDAKLISHPTDEFYLSQLNEAKNQIDLTKASFDGYENFLYTNPAWYAEHTNTYNGVTSASLYDSQNQGSLINNVPSFMVEDDSNDDYIKFVGMIGHYFDNLSVYISQFTDKNDPSSSPNRGISLDMVNDVLISLGWEPEISRENLPLLLGSFSKSDFSSDSPLYDKVGEISENDRNKLIWKRILNTLPFIYKTKGTKASINAIISCFGIPKNILKIKEYGSIDAAPNLDDQALYVFEETKYEPYFSGSGEYFALPWTGSVNSVEFDVRFDTDKISTEGQVFRLVSCENNWVVGVYRDRGKEWGRVFLSIGDGTGSITTSMTQKVPLFDGTSYTVLLRKDTIGNPIEYPVEYELLVKKADQGRIVFSASSSLILSGSYNTVFQSGSNIYFGNYHQSTASLGVDPEAFYGNLDEMKLWEIPIDNHSLETHTLYRGGYNYSSPETMVEKLVARVSFNQPINLHSTTNSSSFYNLAFRNDYPTITAINFPVREGMSEEYSECNIPDNVPLYPYQFSANNTIQAARVSSYGSQTMRSNKISHVTQTLVGSLSSEGRSTLKASQDTPTDSNKVGVFFSPIDAQNEEIIKFFGDYNFGELIGDPALTYASSYRQFEKFRQIYYDQGFGIVDYQTFMNLVKAYFDKSMFKYISTVVPARSKLVSGILVEPSILERPKIQLKPVVRENINQNIGAVNSQETIRAYSIGCVTSSIDIGCRGQSILNDVNQRFYGDVPDSYCLGAYAEDGVYYYKDDYYRVDVILDRKAYQTQRNYTLPKSQWNDYERMTNLDGAVQTIARSYYKLNLIKLPIITEHTFTGSWGGGNSTSWYFSGPISIPLDNYYVGWVSTAISSSHTITGITSGSLYGIRDGETGNQLGVIVQPMLMSASFYQISSSVLYEGYYYVVSGGYTFEGEITLNGTPPMPLASASQFFCKFISSNPTSSIYREMAIKTSQLGGTAGLFVNNKEILKRREKSLEVVPENREMLIGYFPTHYKYKKQVFSQKEINSIENFYDQNGKASPRQAKWKRNSQNKRTTVDASTGNLNSTEPIERKTA